MKNILFFIALFAAVSFSRGQQLLYMDMDNWENNAWIPDWRTSYSYNPDGNRLEK